MQQLDAGVMQALNRSATAETTGVSQQPKHQRQLFSASTTPLVQRDFDTTQNLPTSADLTAGFQNKKQMGRAKFWRLGQANTELKKVFGALDEYQAYLQAYEVIGPAEFEVEDQVENFQRSLNNVVATVKHYVRKRPDGQKTPKIQELGTLATDVLRKLTVISSNSTKYLGLKWQRMLVVSGGDLAKFQSNIDFSADHINEFETDADAINRGIKQLDPEIYAEIEKTNKGIKSGKNKSGEPGEIKDSSKGISGAYLVPNGFFKPFSQSPSRDDSGLVRGYQNFREVLAYEISKYIQGLFKQIGVEQNLGIAKTSFAAFSNDKFASGGTNWNDRIQNKGFSRVPAAEMPEQVGIWQERINIEDNYYEAQHSVKMKNDPETQKQVQQVAFFDLMTGNYDRHNQNLVFDTEGKLRPIDQGEILPNFDLYEAHNREGEAWGGDADARLAWSGMAAAKAGFSDEFKALADAIDPAKVISDLKAIATQYSTVLGIDKLTKDVISEESWQIMHLHLVALKEGIKAGLSPRELAEIFAKGEATNETKQGELYQTLKGVNKNHGIEPQNRTQTSELTQQELAAAEQKVIQAIQNGKKRLRQVQQADPNAKA
jgi:hypothetical protein